jgi:hypothetical protein
VEVRVGGERRIQGLDRSILIATGAFQDADVCVDHGVVRFEAQGLVQRTLGAGKIAARPLAARQPEVHVC